MIYFYLLWIFMLVIRNHFSPPKQGHFCEVNTQNRVLFTKTTGFCEFVFLIQRTFYYRANLSWLNPFSIAIPNLLVQNLRAFYFLSATAFLPFAG